jgi:hypothetical protein
VAEAKRLLSNAFGSGQMFLAGISSGAHQKLIKTNGAANLCNILLETDNSGPLSRR